MPVAIATVRAARPDDHAPLFNVIYGDLKATFHVGTYRDIPEMKWGDVAQWFSVRLSAARKQKQRNRYSAFTAPARTSRAVPRSLRW